MPGPVTYSSSLLVDFSSPVRIVPIKFVVNRIESKLNWNAILRPFSLQVWLAILTTIVSAGFFVTKIINYNLKRDGIREHWTFQKTFWFLFVVLNRQAVNMNPIRRFPSRLSVGIWLLSTLIMVSSYSGILMSYLTAPSSQSVPTTFLELAELVKRGIYSCGISADDTMYKMLNESGFEFTKILLEDVTSKDNVVDNPTKVVAKLQKGHFAYITTVLYYKGVIQPEKGHWVTSVDSLAEIPVSYGINKRFPYRKYIDRTISTLAAGGLLQSRKKRIADSVEEKTKEIRPLTVENFLAAFLLLGIGYAVSIIALILELIIRRQWPVRNSVSTISS
ncbi:glutamate receptor ionotropic, delta-2-like [Centruroides sculpturatus]|uniref:glutamate receptor ionotropic, delta-2-like n=1 Tax=Centruroides sculpturatus TaxID=218467 RepID=UPI000C6E02A6|nr:glutamate receptor ionotropic, delta-2-like [Centruroides sculpturatus]